MISSLKRLQLNYKFLSANLSGYTYTELICLRIAFVGFLFYIAQEMYKLDVPKILLHFWALSMLFLSYAAIASSYRNFKECNALLIKNTFPVQGKIFIYGSILLKMTPKGVKYVGGAVGVVTTINYGTTELFGISPLHEIGKFMGWKGPSIEQLEMQNQSLHAENVQQKQLIKELQKKLDDIDKK